MRLTPRLALTAALAALLTSASCSSSDAPTDAPPPPVAAEARPAPGGLRRLLARQYVNSVRALLGDAAAAEAAPPPDSTLNGFSGIAARQLGVSDSMVSQYERSAEAVAEAAVADGAHVAELLDGCDEEAACYEAFVTRFGRLAFRRPLQPDEVDDYVEAAALGAEHFGSFEGGLQAIVSAMLQSPSFLYRVELGAAESEHDGTRPLDGYEVATRLSFFLLDTTPSAALLDAAERGDLGDEAGVRAAAEELLRSARARAAIAAFFVEYLDLDGLESLGKDPGVFPSFSAELGASMQEETLRLMADVVWDSDASAARLLDADYTFVDRRLAAHYGIEEAPLEADTWVRAHHPEEQRRRGVLGHASILSMQAHATSTSPTYRGIFIIERLLCRGVPPAPNDVVTELPPSSEAATMRERLAVHMADEYCRGCHYMTDGFGLALENYDGVGAFRLTENGESIDASGDITRIGSFDGPAELAELLAGSDEVMRCMVRQLFRHATGHVETKAELPAIDALEASFASAGHRFQRLIVDLVASEAFRRVGAPVTQEGEGAAKPPTAAAIDKEVDR